jgi:hypothetical protein
MPWIHCVNADHAMAKLDYGEMVALSEMFADWAFNEERLDDVQRTKTLQMSADYERIAAYCGPGWKAREPVDEPHLMQFLARWCMATAGKARGSPAPSGLPLATTGEFPISARDVRPAIDFLRRQLEYEADHDVEKLAAAINALDRMPIPTFDLMLDLTFSVRDHHFLEWVALQMTETIVSFTAGEHVYDPEIGGDSFTDVLYECQSDGQQSGDVDAWVRKLLSFDQSKIHISLEVDF